MKNGNQTIATSRVLRTLLATGALAAMTMPALAQTSTWNSDGPDDNWFTADNWDNDEVPNVAGESAIVGAPSPTFLNGNVKIDSLTVLLGGDLTINSGFNLDVDGDAGTSFIDNAGIITAANNTDFRIINTVTNSGTIFITSTGSFTDLELGVGGATLTGGGEIIFNGTNAGINDVSGAQLLTIADQTLSGFGNLGRNSIDFVNQANGLIDADNTGNVLLIDALNTFTNAGTLRASNGGELQISTITAFDNTGGVIEALAGSVAKTGNATVVTINDGIVRGVGTGEFRVGEGSSTTFLDTTFEGTIIAENNTDFGIGGIINNTGTIEIASGVSFTDLEVQVGGATLIGGGEIIFTGNNAGLNDVSGTQVLTISDQTLRGVGNLGRNSTDFINQAGGLIDADVNASTLIVDPASTFTNAGTMRATNGGTLQLNTGTFENAGGVIEALAGSVAKTGNATVVTINDGTVRGVGTGEFRVGEGSSTTFLDTTFEGSIIAENNTDFGIGGIINNTGTIEIASGVSFTDVEVQVGGATLIGGGEIIFTGNNAGVNDVSGTQVLTISDQTLRGVGNLGRNNTDFINQAGGLIDADDAGGGSLIIDPFNTFTNAGTMRATNGGTLQLNTGTFENAGGVIEALDGSIAKTGNLASVTINDGIVRGVGTGEFRVGTGSNTTFFDTTFEGSIIAENNTDFGIGGTINNSGTIEIASTGSFTDVEVQVGGATLTGGGEIIFSGTNAGINDISGVQTLTIADQTLSGEGNFGQNTMNFVNQAGSLIDADVSGSTLIIDPFSTFDNAGTLRAINNGTLQLNGGTFDNTGTIDARQGGTVTNSGATINQLVEDGTIGDQITGGTYNAFNGTLNVALANFDARFNSGTLNFFGTNAQTNLFDESASTPGNIVSQVFSFNDGTVFVQGGASLTTNVETFNNAGTVNIIGNSVFAVVNNGENGEFYNGSPNTLRGNGTLQADLVNDASGVVSPGSNNSVATLTIDGDAILGANGSLLVDIDGTANSDLLAVTGTLSLDGTLDIDLVGSFEPIVGEQFLIATAAPGSITGDFATITDNSATYDFFTVIDAPNGQVFIEVVPEPSSLALLSIAGLGLLRRRRAS